MILKVYVAELNPTKAYKFVSVNYKPSNQSSLNVKPATLGMSNIYLVKHIK